MLEIKLYVTVDEIKETYENGADAEIITVSLPNGKTYCFETESQTENGEHFCILCCYEQENEETIDKFSAFGLLKDLAECKSEREVISKVMDWLGM